MATIDDKITSLFGVLKTKQAELQKLEAKLKTPWVTNCAWVNLYTKTHTNIQTASSDEVFDIAMQLTSHTYFASSAAAQLGMAQVPTKINGHIYENWTLDLQKRLASIEIREKRTGLAELETRLGAIVSPEQRREMELEAITKSLGV